MLYSLLAAVLILSFFNALIVPFMVIRYFLKCYNVNADVKIPMENVIDVVKPQEKPEIDKKTATILRNIDRYDGTSKGQEVIR